MRKIATIIFALSAAVCLSAQGIPEGSHWFDGSAYYTATELEGSILFSGDSADGTYTFAFRLERTKTQGTYRLAKATEFWAKTQPLEKMASSYVMNTAFLSRIPKEKLREMVSLLETRPARSIIEQTNLSLMRSELKVTEAERRGQL